MTNIFVDNVSNFLLLTVITLKLFTKEIDSTDNDIIITDNNRDNTNDNTITCLPAFVFYLVCGLIMVALLNIDIGHGSTNQQNNISTPENQNGGVGASRGVRWQRRPRGGSRKCLGKDEVP